MKRVRQIVQSGALFLLACCGASAAKSLEPCRTIHGRAHLYGGDGQLRIWHVGTHHEFQPYGASESLVIKWLEAGVSESQRGEYAMPSSIMFLFADFVICPIEPYRVGAVQRVVVKSAAHRRYVSAE